MFAPNYVDKDALRGKSLRIGLITAFHVSYAVISIHFNAILHCYLLPLFGIFILYSILLFNHKIFSEWFTQQNNTFVPIQKGLAKRQTPAKSHLGDN